MRKIELVLLLTSAVAMAQSPPHKAGNQKISVTRDSGGNTQVLCGPNKDQPCVAGGAPPSPAKIPPAPPFTQLEQTIVKEIQAKHDELQQLVNEFLEEVRKAHPGYEFSNGSLVPIPPPAAPKIKDEKKP